MSTTVTDLTTYPVSSVPAAFDRGHLYSPTTTHLAWALDPGILYDYRPGNDFEPMPEAPRGNPKAWAWWWKNTAKVETPDFLGLRAGDGITVQHVGSVGPGEVVSTWRYGAVVRYPLPVSNLTNRTHSEMVVRRRNDAGHWYP